MDIPSDTTTEGFVSLLKQIFLGFKKRSEN